MATLTSTKIKNTYDALLKASDNDAIGSSAKQITDGLGNGTPLYISTTQIGIGVTPEATYDLHVYSNAKVGGNLTVTGDLTVEGTTTTIDTQTLTVEDPLIEVASNNTSTDAVDIGFYGKYAPSGTTLYAGLFRDTGDSKFKLFKNLEEQPTTTVNTSGTGYTVATLVGNVEGTLTGVIASTTTATTQSANDNSTKVATTAYVDNQVGLFDTLSEVLANGNTTGGTDIAVSANDDITFADSSKAIFGNSIDLQIYSDGSYNYIHCTSNELRIRSNDLRLLNEAGTANYITADNLQDVSLYYNNSKKLETTTTGITVTGAVSATTFSGQLDGTISSTTTATTQTQGDNSTKVATTAYVDLAVDGVDTLSEVLANGNTTGGTSISVSANDDIDFSDSSEARFGSDQDLIVKHNGTQGVITNNTGTLQFVQNTNDGDIKFFCDDGSGGTENYFQIDGGEQRIKVFNQMRFNDNVELRLGTGSDLRIYHDDSNSYISDEGTGNLFIQASNSLNLRSTSGEWYMDGIANGAVNLYYNNVKKFETTSTGVIVTGGLSTSNSITLSNPTDKYIRFIDTYGNWDIEVGDGANNFKIHSVSLAADYLTLEGDGQLNLGEYGSGSFTGTATYRLAVDSSGDVIEIPIGDGAVDGSGAAGQVAFWTDTDTIDGENNLYWDSTNDRLGIGVSTPSQKLHVDGNIRVGNSADAIYSNRFFGLSNAAVYVQSNSGYPIIFNAGASEKMRIDSSGLVGIGTTSIPNPFSGAYNNVLQVGTTAGHTRLAITAGSTKSSDLNFADSNDAANVGSYAGGISYKHNGDFMLFSTNGTEKMRITSGGNVGIGTDSPDGNLEVIASATVSGASDSVNNVLIGLQAANRPTIILDTADTTYTNRTWNITNVGSAGSLFFGRNGLDVLVMKNDGKVGIGETSPDAKLHVVTSDQSIAKFESSNSDGPYTSYYQGSTALGFIGNAQGLANAGSTNMCVRGQNELVFAISSSEKMRIDSSGLVGIGTESPSANLHIASTGDAILKLEADTDNVTETDNPQIHFIQDGGAVNATIGYRATDNEFIIQNQYSSPVVFETNNTEIMRITSSGRVGIGLTNPDSFYADQLVVNEGMTLYSTGNSFLCFADGTSGDDRRRGEVRYEHSTNSMVFMTDATNRMTIDSSGNVGIGTDSPQSLLHISATAPIISLTDTNSFSDANDRLIFRAGANEGLIQWYDDSAGSTSTIAVFESNGNVGIGLTSPDAKLEVTGGGSAYTFRGVYSGTSGSYASAAFQLTGGSTSPSLIDFIYSTTYVGQIITTGSGVLYQSNSDYRLKENVVEMTGALDRLNQLKPSRFNFIGHQDTVDGFLAHELQEIVPQAVSGEKDGTREDGTPKYQGVDNSQIVPLLVGAIQELKAEIETLKAQINN